MLYFSNAQHEQYDKALLDYAGSKVRGCFELDEGAHEIAGRIDCDAGREKDLFERVRTLIRDDHRIFEVEGHCALRTKFFNGARFKIIPSDLELINGILLPGDRFEAFNPCELGSDEFKIFVPGANEPLRLTTIRSDFGKLAPYYLLLGHGGMLGAEGLAVPERRLALGFATDTLRPDHPVRDRISAELGLPFRHW